MSDAKATKQSEREESTSGLVHPSGITPITRATRHAELDLDFMRKTLRKSTGDEDSVVPALQLSLTLRGPAEQAAARVLTALDRYDALIAPEALRSAVIGQDVARLTERRRERDRVALASLGAAPVKLWYASTAFGSPGDFGVRVHVSAAPGDACYVRFAFPWRDAEGASVTGFLERALSLVTTLPVDSGTLGFGFEQWHFDSFARDHVHTLLMRYAGFHHSVPGASAATRGRAPTPSWLTFLGPDVASALGGRRALEASLASARVWSVGETVVLRASEHPALGDLTVGATDLGALPDVARVLAPVRAAPPSFGGNIVMIDEEAWASRLASLESGPFVNRG